LRNTPEETGAAGQLGAMTTAPAVSLAGRGGARRNSEAREKSSAGKSPHSAGGRAGSADLGVKAVAAGAGAALAGRSVGETRELFAHFYFA
jgi:hypothetical protein